MDLDTVDLKSFVGRSYEQVNCWQLVREFYLRVFHVELDSYVDLTPAERSQINEVVRANVTDFEKVLEPRFGDLILIKILGIESHIAIYVGQGKLLHSYRNTGSVIDSVDKWSPRISGYYRHKATRK